ncbi:hypothetical protein [Streptomyces sp. NPDC051567]|uniref:hypothetical protein n=1 Tax=Streptomyces sp. NPDC051567 TaxID=3365660 RepID=UPI00379A3525
MISRVFETAATDVVTCEACGREPVQPVRTTPDSPHRDLLCGSCAEQNAPVRAGLFPPPGIYRLTWGQHHDGKAPPGPGVVSETFKTRVRGRG